MFKQKSTAMLLGSVTLTAALLTQSAHATGVRNEDENDGKWLAGEYHVHTFQSDDAQHSLTSMLDAGLEKYGLDWMGTADHLRMESRDDEGNPIPGGPIPLSQGMLQYQVPKIKQLQAEGKYKGKIIFSGFEWDMPTYEHVGVGLLTDNPGSDESLKAASHFEYLFTNRDEKLFDPADVAAWSAKDARAFSTKEDARTALKWLETNYKDTSFALFNHPNRKMVYTIEDFRDFNNIAPTVAFGFEGMVGNQMEPDRGGENLDNPKNRTYGGSDYMLAHLGGAWDALLGEGRKFFNFSNSDAHFYISDNRLYSSGYDPGQYSKNYTWIKGNDALAVLNGMRSGKSFSVFGDLINALDFNVTQDNSENRSDAGMGETIVARDGKQLTITIKFKSSEKNNNGDQVKVDHVDLITGDITGKKMPGTPEYAKDTNDSTVVLKRFTSKDWKTTKDGYNVITYKLKATKDQYFRLRGTNLGTDIPGETQNGEPLMDVKTDIADNEARFEAINKRNYSDLWFYSNPIYVSVIK
ncbi:S-layer protein [Paenibacillus montanisoli]|uniref:S-layer protein n=1 Tax=Paenibacillus montanisoli TaxID=2081970 RepID=A0A328UAA2_9BACL|nr:S-layer protein [Paenibacillus montanisoli]RAP77164.1 S-layer protein [Paenibacillus montanisoli]